MNKVSIHSVFLVLIVVILFISCKKQKSKYYSTHAFWFDKATRDSLVKSGNYYLAARYDDYTPENGESGFLSYADTMSFFSSSPGCDAKNIMFIKLKLEKGEQKSISYKICKAEKTDSGTITNNNVVKNWQGEIIIREGDCGQTQLKW